MNIFSLHFWTNYTIQKKIENVLLRILERNYQIIFNSSITSTGVVHGGGWCGQCGHSPNTGGPSEVATLSSFLPTVSATESSSTLDLDITESSHSSSSLLGSNSAETFKILRHLSRSMNLSPVTLPSERFIRVQNIGIHQLISNSSHTPPETQENKHY